MRYNELFALSLDKNASNFDVSIESLLRETEISTESIFSSIGNGLKKIWEFIKNAFMKLVNLVKKIFGSKEQKIDEVLDQMEKDIEEAFKGIEQELRDTIKKSGKQIDVAKYMPAVCYIFKIKSAQDLFKIKDYDVEALDFSYKSIVRLNSSAMHFAEFAEHFENIPGINIDSAMAKELNYTAKSIGGIHIPSGADAMTRVINVGSDLVHIFYLGSQFLTDKKSVSNSMKSIVVNIKKSENFNKKEVLIEIPHPDDLKKILVHLKNNVIRKTKVINDNILKEIDKALNSSYKQKADEKTKEGYKLVNQEHEILSPSEIIKLLQSLVVKFNANVDRVTSDRVDGFIKFSEACVKMLTHGDSEE